MIRQFTSWVSRQLARFGGWLVGKFGTPVPAPEPEVKEEWPVLAALNVVAKEVGAPELGPEDLFDEYDWRRCFRTLIRYRDVQNASFQEQRVAWRATKIEEALTSKDAEELSEQLKWLLNDLRGDWRRARME